MTMKRIKVVVIGYGYWGPNLVRNILLNDDYELMCIVDSDKKSARIAFEKHGVLTKSSVHEIPELRSIDLAVIATRPSSHLELISLLADFQINCLVTKPSGKSKQDALAIKDISTKRNIKVYCDFTYHFSSYINYLLQDKKAREIISEMREYVSYRTSLGIIQADVDVIADLAVHDIYILKLLKGKMPSSVSAISIGVDSGNQVESAFISLMWNDNFRAALHVSWKSPKKSRLISIISDKAGITLEELNPNAPVQIVQITPGFKSSTQLGRDLVKTRNESYSIGSIEQPTIALTESLASEFEALVEALRNNGEFPSISDAVDVWSVVDGIRKSIKNDGEKVEI
jgi:predicted dehydrogenase